MFVHFSCWCKDFHEQGGGSTLLTLNGQTIKNTIKSVINFLLSRFFVACLESFDRCHQSIDFQIEINFENAPFPPM